MKIYLKNPFNTLRRDIILVAIEKHFQELMSCATSTVDSSADLQFGEFVISSIERTQQGDPPLHSCSSSSNYFGPFSLN